MAYNYGLTGLITFTSSSAFSLGTPIRIFDLCLGTTAAAASAVLWPLTGVDATIPTTGSFPVVAVKAGGVFNSNAGLRFPNGVYCFLSGAGSATVNYIREF